MVSLRHVLVVVAALVVASCGDGGVFSGIGEVDLDCKGKPRRDFSGVYKGTTKTGFGESERRFPVTLEVRQTGSSVSGFVEIEGCVDRLPVSGKVIEKCLEVSGERPGERVVVEYSWLGFWSVDVYAGQSKCAGAWEDFSADLTKVG